MKSKVDDLDVGKIKPIPVELKKLSNVVEKNVLKNSKDNTDKQNLGKNKKILKTKYLMLAN